MTKKDLLLLAFAGGCAALAWYFLNKKKASAKQIDSSGIMSDLESKYTQPVYETRPADIDSSREYMVA